jgi:hypothetical protein
MDKINKLSLPVTILIASIILGSFYYFSEINKQKSIERQQENKIADEKRIEDNIYNQKAREDSQRNLCVETAESQAQASYRDYCTQRNYCTYKEGTYLTKQYDTYYNTCLQRFGLD